LEEIVAAPVKKTETNGREDPLRNTLYPQKLALLRQQAASSVGIVCWRSKATEFSFLNFSGFSSKGANFDKFKSGGLHEKHAVATRNLGTISAFA
jgi:hypothetical protein